MKKLLIGTGNLGKIAFYKSVLSSSDYQVVTPQDLNINIHIEEDIIDILGNAIKKATLFAQASGLITLSDDTGIFIPALGNKPGVAARRWDGELPDSISDQDWLTFFWNKIDNLKDEELYCYKNHVVCIATPDGKHWELEFKEDGKLSKEKRSTGFNPGKPFSAHFFIDRFNKLEADLNEGELQTYTTEVQKEVQKILTTI